MRRDLVSTIYGGLAPRVDMVALWNVIDDLPVDEAAAMRQLFDEKGWRTDVPAMPLRKSSARALRHLRHPNSRRKYEIEKLEEQDLTLRERVDALELRVEALAAEVIQLKSKT